MPPIPDVDAAMDGTLPRLDETVKEMVGELPESESLEATQSVKRALEQLAERQNKKLKAIALVAGVVSAGGRGSVG